MVAHGSIVITPLITCLEMPEPSAQQKCVASRQKIRVLRLYASFVEQKEM